MSELFEEMQGDQDSGISVTGGKRTNRVGSCRPYCRLFSEYDGKPLEACWKEPSGHSILMPQILVEDINQIPIPKEVKYYSGRVSSDNGLLSTSMSFK